MKRTNRAGWRFWLDGGGVSQCLGGMPAYKCLGAGCVCKLMLGGCSAAAQPPQVGRPMHSLAVARSLPSISTDTTLLLQQLHGPHKSARPAPPLSSQSPRHHVTTSPRHQSAPPQATAKLSPQSMPSCSARCLISTSHRSKLGHFSRIVARPVFSTIL